LILRKIIRIVATRCQILKLRRTKFDFGLGSAPKPRRGVLPTPSIWINGPIYSGADSMAQMLPHFYKWLGTGGEHRGWKNCKQWLKTRDPTSRDHRNCGGWHRETGQVGTISQGWMDIVQPMRSSY